MGVMRGVRSRRGQMTVELAVAMPALIIVMAITVNAMTFFGDCAVFDRVAHEAVRVYDSAPAYRQGMDRGCELVEQAVRSQLDEPNLRVKVSHGVTPADYDEFTATLEYYPTLFGGEIKSDIFGVTFPHLTHTTRYVVDSYRPGVIL